MNLVTWLVLAAVAAWLFLVLRRIKKKKAAAFSCGGDCSKCVAGCAYRRQRLSGSGSRSDSDGAGPADAP